MKSFTLHYTRSSNERTLVYNLKTSSIAGILLLMVLFYCLSGIQKLQAQTYGSPLFTEVFGTVPTGTTNPQYYRTDITGRGTVGSAYIFNPSGQTDDGKYALTPNPTKIHSSDWIDMADHTPNDNNGLMLVVNAALTKGLFYKRAVTGLCYNSQFEFKAYYTNVIHQLLGCSPDQIPINIRFEIWSKDPGDSETNSTVLEGNQAPNGAILLKATNTGDVQSTAQTRSGSYPNYTYSQNVSWRSKSLIFVVPQSTDGAFLVLRNNGNGGCGNDLAIDDITFSPYIPFSIGYVKDQTNYCTTGKIKLTATLTSGAIPSAIPYVYQWQQAQAGTTNWVNIGSPIADFSQAIIELNVGDISNKNYRIISAASVQNFNNTNCYVASSIFDGNSVVLPTGSLTAPPDICGSASHTPVNATFTVNYQGNKFPWTYYYQINGGVTLSQIVNSPNIVNSKTISITDNTIVTLGSISTSDCTVPINSQKSIIYSIGSPQTPIQITGPNPACIGEEADFSVAEVQGAITYTWMVSDGWSIISGQGTRSVRLMVGNSPITIVINSANACGSNTWTSTLFTTTNSAPAVPANITTPNGFCFPSIATPGSTNIVFETPEVAGAQNYIWEWDSPVVIGVQQSGTGQYLKKIVLSVPNSVTSFKVRVKSQNGCGNSDNREVTFTPNRPPSASITNNSGTTVLTCTTTAINVTATGGGTYSWTGGSSPATAANSFSSPGIYTVTVTSANGCTDTESITITEPAAGLTASLTSQVNVLCKGSSTGSAVITPAGGTSPYVITPAQTGLAAGVHTFTVTDNNGCTTTVNVTITEPAAGLTASVTSQVNVLCKGSSTGSAVITPAGGTSPYVITPAQTGLAAGLHTFTVTDNNGCTTTVNVTITEPAAALTTTTTTVNVACSGGTSGSATATVSGGTVPYSYSWNTLPVQTDATATNLKAGTYNVTVTDNNGCVKTSLATVNESDILMNVISTSVPVGCKGSSNGSINLTVSGGTAPFIYAWTGPGSFSASTKDLTGIAAGNYNVTVTEAYGCVKTSSVTVNESGIIMSLIATPVPVTCSGSRNGSVKLVIAGGTAPFTYVWTGPDNFKASTQDLSGLAGGTYEVTVTDAFGCVKTTSAIVNESGEVLRLTTISKFATLTRSPDGTTTLRFSGGSIDLAVTGGTALYTYNWTGPDNFSASSRDLTDLAGGNYNVTVTDSYGCSKTTSAIVDVQIVLGVDESCEIFVPNVFTPNGDGVHDYFEIKCLYNYENAEIQIFNRNGNILFKKDHYGNTDFWGSKEQAYWNGRSENKLNYMGSELPVGTYYYILKLGNGKVLTGYIFLAK